MSKSNIQIGDKYNLLTIKNLAGQDKDTLKLVNCLCECGKEIVIQFSYLKRGKTKSCGCIRDMKAAARLKRHGMRFSREYSSWCAMKCRCLDINTPMYQTYGAVGITICQSWIESFENFYADMGERPEGTSLNRINGAKIYSKETCEWATAEKQARDQKTERNTVVGVRGITRVRGMYSVRIAVSGTRLYIGQFDDFFEACCARKSAELKYWK